MDIFLGKVTQQAMNYAIRSGITITTGYAIRECSRLLKNVKDKDKEELNLLKQKLDGKIRIISPAIDMIELISARGNTSLESAVSLAKALRWDIQSLGLRLAKAANAEELARQEGSNVKARAHNELEFKMIIQTIRKLLERIEDAVPLINLAITTSGASLSTNLPATISPSRLLQASTFLTAGDTQFSIMPGQTVQIGPAFTLSLYMLFTGHSYRIVDEEGVKEATWKEVIHKARVKLLRTPLEAMYDHPMSEEEHYRERPCGDSEENGDHNGRTSSPGDAFFASHIAGEARADEFAYQLMIIEDLNDDRAHNFEEDEAQPGPCEEVELAGTREVIPIHEISKIFYADTGKILNIGNEGEVNSPVLLLKRDVNAVPPRRMMDNVNKDEIYADVSDSANRSVDESQGIDKSQFELDAQFSRGKRSASDQATDENPDPPPQHNPWRFPPNLDFEWLAFEVYTEPEDSESDVEDSEIEAPQSSSVQATREGSLDPNLSSALAAVRLHNGDSSGSLPTNSQNLIQTPNHPSPFPFMASNTSNAGPVRTSLSLLETLIRLTALQQFQQTSHLAINDELLNFFLEESSTTGAGGDGDERRQKREAARRRVGFDPYDESPIKRRGEAYLDQMHNPQEQNFFEESFVSSPAREGHRGWTPRAKEWTPDLRSPLLLRNGSSSPRATTPDGETPVSAASVGYTSPSPSSPMEAAKGRQALLRKDTGKGVKEASPLGRFVPVGADSSLGTSPPSGASRGNET